MILSLHRRPRLRAVRLSYRQVLTSLIRALGNCLFAENLLYCQGESGTMGLIEPSPAAYKEISRFQFQPAEQGGPFWAPSGHIWTVPAIANGRLYLRDQDNLYAYDIKR